MSIPNQTLDQLKKLVQDQSRQQIENTTKIGKSALLSRFCKERYTTIIFYKFNVCKKSKDFCWQPEIML